MILLIDNYDSFVFNLFHLISSCSNEEIQIFRNDKITCDKISALSPSAIFLSPGPGKPEDAGVMIDAIKAFRGIIPIFGVCLGHQAICTAYGASVSYAKSLMHGKQSKIYYNSDSVIFKGLENPFPAARYHSLSLVEHTLVPSCGLKITAKSTDGEVMAVEDEKNKVFGVQFHPESVMTPGGSSIISAFFDFIS